MHRLIDVELQEDDRGTEPAKTREERRQWLHWTVLSYEQLEQLAQPPYGDRALVLKSTGRIIGACGYVPCLNAFDQMPLLRPAGESGAPDTLNTPEFGLYWAVAPAHRRQGYATEAARALVEYAFDSLRLKRIVATTDDENHASQGVMRKLGMRLDVNPCPGPPWLQVVGFLENPALRSEPTSGNP